MFGSNEFQLYVLPFRWAIEFTSTHTPFPGFWPQSTSIYVFNGFWARSLRYTKRKHTLFRIRRAISTSTVWNGYNNITGTDRMKSKRKYIQVPVYEGRKKKVRRQNRTEEILLPNTIRIQFKFKIVLCGSLHLNEDSYSHELVSIRFHRTASSHRRYEYVCLSRGATAEACESYAVHEKFLYARVAWHT